MIAVAFSTRLHRLAAVVRNRTAANGDSIGFVVRRSLQCAFRPWLFEGHSTLSRSETASTLPRASVWERLDQLSGRPDCRGMIRDVGAFSLMSTSEALLIHVERTFMPRLSSDWGCAPSRAFLLRVRVPPHPRRGDA